MLTIFDLNSRLLICSAMIGHEQMHIGQIVAFCYAIGVQIPEKIVNKMALDG